MHSRRTGTLGVVSSVHWVRSAALASAVSGVALLGGCDRSSTVATISVTHDIDTAVVRINGTDADRNEAEKSLRDAIKETAAAPEQMVYAKSLLALVELRSAEALQPQIDSNQAALLARNWEIGQLAGNVYSVAGLTTALGKLDPAPALAAVKKNTADAQGSADAPDWVKTDSGSVPSLAAVTADIAKLNDQITALQAKLKQLNDQHTQLETQADQLDQQSIQAKGDAGVQQFTQASNLRKQANDLTVQIDETNVQLSRAQADLNVRTGQQTAVTAAVTDFGTVGSQLDQNWQSVQKQAEGTSAQAKALVGDPTTPAETDPTGGSTLASKAARLQQLVENDTKLRGQAEAHVNSAIDFINQAITQAQKVQLDLSTKTRAPETQDKPEVAAWNAIIAAIDPARLQLQLASAQLHKANLYAGQAATLAARQSTFALVTAAAEAAKVTLPDTLAADPKLADDLTAARTSAASAFNDATATLNTIAQGSAPDVDKQDAALAATYAYYQWSLLDTASADAKSASEHLKLAKDNRDLITPVPTGLPAALAIAPAKPAATQPHDAGRHDAGRNDSGRNDSGRNDSGRNDSGRHDAAGMRRSASLAFHAGQSK